MRARLQHIVTSRPLLSASCAGFVIASSGDIACQLGFEKRNAIDWKRTLDMGVVRALVMAPFLYVYFPRLAAAVPGTSMAAIARRIFVDQTVGSPISICLTFVASSALLGKVVDAPARIEQQLFPTWLNSISYWPFAHIITFRFIPVRYQAHFANVLSVYWNMVRSRLCVCVCVCV
jgi:hypothetical protein